MRENKNPRMECIITRGRMHHASMDSFGIGSLDDLDFVTHAHEFEEFSGFFIWQADAAMGGWAARHVAAVQTYGTAV